MNYELIGYLYRNMNDSSNYITKSLPWHIWWLTKVYCCSPLHSLQAAITRSYALSLQLMCWYILMQSPLKCCNFFWISWALVAILLPPGGSVSVWENDYTPCRINTSPWIFSVLTLTDSKDNQWGVCECVFVIILNS